MLDLYRDKKVLVIGHTGFKGSWLSEWLISLGAEVSGFSLYEPSQPCHGSLLHLQQRLQHHEGDVRDLKQLKGALQAIQPEIIFHLAAQPIVSQSLRDPIETFHTNILGTAHVLEAVRHTASVKVAVIITSDKCYENVEWEYGYRERDPLGGKDPYSASKAGAEIVFHSYFRSYFCSDNSHPKMATTRAGNVIGGGDWAQDRLIPDCVKAWAQHQTPLIRSPFATRPWQHVLEPLSGYLYLGAQLLLGKEGLNGESFNFGPRAEVNQSVAEVLSECQKTWTKAQFETKADPLSQKECGLLKLNCDKALRRLSWRPTLNFEESIEMTMRWYKTFYEDRGQQIKELTQNQIAEYCQLAKDRGCTWSR